MTGISSRPVTRPVNRGNYIHVRPSARVARMRASVNAMPVIPQQPLNPQGGDAEVFGSRFHDDTAAILHLVMEGYGYNKSEALRFVVERGAKALVSEGVLNLPRREVSARAS